MHYNTYWNKRYRRLYDRPKSQQPWEPKTSASAPGHKFDPKNKKPGGFMRFERWCKLPVKAQKLYWRRNKLAY